MRCLAPLALLLLAGCGGGVGGGATSGGEAGAACVAAARAASGAAEVRVAAAPATSGGRLLVPLDVAGTPWSCLIGPGGRVGDLGPTFG